MKQKTQAILLRVAVYLSVAIVVFIVASMVLFVLIKGVIYIKPSHFALHYTSENASLLPALLNTLVVLFLALVISIPIGVGAAIYLAEYARTKYLYVKNFVKIVAITAQTLSGIPSIIYGLVGYMIFVVACKWQFSLLSGAATLSIMILPVIMRTSQEALLAVPNTLREASLALGASKFYTLWHVTLRASMRGIINGIVLGAGRVLGESAALIYTAGTVANLPKSLMGSGRTLAVHLYCLWAEGLQVQSSYATATVLIVFVLVLMMLSRFLTKS